MQWVLMAFTFLTFYWFILVGLRIYDVGFAVVGNFAPQVVAAYYLLEAVSCYYILDTAANNSK